MHGLPYFIYNSTVVMVFYTRNQEQDDKSVKVISLLGPFQGVRGEIFAWILC